MSFTSVDFPEPDTPVTQVNVPSGMRTGIALRLCSRAPWMVRNLPVPVRRVAGTGIERSRDRYRPVSDFWSAMISAGVPVATT
jgi:hypothetical protein